ncbi:hypothetical protein [Tumebacillus permanentifrigoris]|uniref:Uncharacterized protein n=1 Tax=Tumebacillus permanentifrigoris TaxID=378543 RepID=A0A316D6M7_9BACL|nr:hypothetical protein [Tumebacillus permanentifrigoris]PWK10323.1 hypothetical protein C7459_112145 [Tumebacillus permanentifrigoris]
MVRFAPFFNTLLFTLAATLSVSRILLHTSAAPYLPYINLALSAVIVLLFYRRMKISIERYYQAAARKRRSS